MRTFDFTCSGYYHIYNRGVDKRKIFMDTYDYRRFRTGMTLFNDSEKHDLKKFWRDRASAVMSHNPLVKIISFCLMPNHFHLLLKPKVADGLSRFMQRLGDGYTKYFNFRHGRTGRLLEAPFQAKEVQTDEYLLHVSRYIHLNPLDLTDPQWKIGQVPDWGLAEKHLREYPWSSFGSYIGETKNLEIDSEEVCRLLPPSLGYSKFVKSWAVGDLSLFDLYAR